MEDDLMKKIDIANGIIFQKMNIQLKTFDERLISQKKIYILQSLGIDLGYSYNWYVYGPYAPTLANYMYNNLDLLNSSDFSEYTLAETVEKNIDMVESLGKGKPADLSLASWYELIASLLYIHNNRESWRINSDEESLFNQLIESKPKYSKEQCEKAWKYLRTNNFIETVDANV